MVAPLPTARRPGRRGMPAWLTGPTPSSTRTPDGRAQRSRTFPGSGAKPWATPGGCWACCARTAGYPAGGPTIALPGARGTVCPVMSERATVYGGTIVAGPCARGWVVQARLPIAPVPQPRRLTFGREPAPVYDLGRRATGQVDTPVGRPRNSNGLSLYIWILNSGRELACFVKACCSHGLTFPPHTGLRRPLAWPSPLSLPSPGPSSPMRY